MPIQARSLRFASLAKFPRLGSRDSLFCPGIRVKFDIRSKRRLLAYVAAAHWLAACSPSGDVAGVSVEPRVSDEQVSALAKRRIFFGHQSVGFNVMEGVEDLVAKRQRSSLKVVLLKGDAAPSGPGFMHAGIGENEKPLTKIDGFAHALQGSMFGSADIALYKFCYVDIRADTDVAALFRRYKYSAAQLQQEYPQTLFVHMTAPLTVVQSGPKAMLKKLLGRPDRWALDNAQRERFNDLMRSEYGKGYFFDLARVESTGQDGRRHSFAAGDREVGVLVNEYSSDGKHLNERGRRWVAAHLLDYLARLPDR